MPILDLQRQARQIGRIRIGAQVKAANGKTRPTKLDAFRFTTNSRHVADQVAALYGGTVGPWAGGTQEFEIFTEATELDVMIPPGDAAVSQWYEMWSGGGCQRRCDGYTETITGKDCMCPPAGLERVAAAVNGQACKPTTRVNVILPDLPDIGTWRYDSGGFYAATELGGAAELLAQAREKGVIVPARLRLEQREVKRGGQTRKFAVVCLDVITTLRELATGTTDGTLRGALPPAPARALTAAPAEAPAQAAPELPEPDLADAQALYVRARAAVTEAELVELGKFAAARGWWNDVVNVGEDVHEELSSAMYQLLEQVRRPA